MPESRSVAFHTLGCKLNYSETSTISRLLENEGFGKKEFDEEADVYVINTCSVTENADKECRQLVRRIQRRNPHGLVVITGCYAQLKPEEISSIPGVDLVLGASEKFNIAKHLKELTKGDSAKICSCDIDEIQDFHSSFSLHDRTRSFLKVQDGCDYQCSFCTIPLARGRSRSDTIASVVDHARKLGENGVKEIVLTGINLGDFGISDGSIAERKENFFGLIRELDKVDEIQRFRISSIEPNLLSNEIIEFVSGSRKFMPHFHIPLQSGSNRILGLMRRRYKRELYADRVGHIKEIMPHCAIGADVIVGFPTESDKDFEETVAFIQSLDISYLHAFTYSERNNTSALDLRPIVHVQKRHERNKILRSLSFEKMQNFTNSQTGQFRKVLFETETRNGMMHGYTDNYIQVATPFRGDWSNQIVEWKL